MFLVLFHVFCVTQRVPAACTTSTPYASIILGQQSHQVSSLTSRHCPCQLESELNTIKAISAVTRQPQQPHPLADRFITSIDMYVLIVQYSVRGVNDFVVHQCPLRHATWKPALKGGPSFDGPG
ncbi:hypothetical protein NXS19_007459 [Fusarium pseudograminearum]|nr:hypothetical protein NXS19_007459 [Fusarium pseudograminearum]